MKNIFKILFVVTLVLSSCDKQFSYGEFDFDEVEVEELDPNQRIVGKKGACFTTKEGNDYNYWDVRLIELKAHWYYSWGLNYSEFSPDNLEFIPMFWGAGLTSATLPGWIETLNNGEHPYILGFNEPDSEHQSNVSVDRAIEKWPLLEAIGLPLGSPAVVQNPATSEWFVEFMERVEENDLRVDFIAYHTYGGASATNLIDNLHQIHDKYGLPIWITEFAVADWTAATVEDNKYTPEQVLEFMEELLPQLEALEFVHRYSWFSFSQTSSAGAPSALFDAENNLTPLGEFYANFTPNNDIGPLKR